MKVEKIEIAGKLRKLKGILNKHMDGTELNGILFRDNYLYATNLEIGIRTALDAQSTNESFIIPQKAIDLIENLPDGIVEIIGGEKSIVIKSGTIKNRYSTFPANTYPEIKTVSTVTNNATIKSTELLDALGSILYAVSENAIKEVMRGVLLDASDGTLNIVGCDGYRIAWNKIKYDGNFKVIIPKSTIKQVLSVGMSGDISFAWDDRCILFKSEEFEIHSRILCGDFIDYRKMFVEYPNQTIIDRKLFIECLKRAMICCEDKVKNALRCSFADKGVSVSLHKSKSEYEETVTLEVPIGDSLDIAFNVRYLLEAMNSFESDKVSIRLGSSVQPIVIDDDDLFAFVLPVRL